MWKGVFGAVLLAAFAALSAQVPPPPPPRGTAAPARAVTTVLTGRVIDAVTRQPIPNTHLSTGPNVVGSPVVLADSEGRFSLPAPSGRFIVVANKTGYAREPIQVTAGVPIEIALQPAAAISGRVIDESGDPVLGARVVVERLQDTNPRRTTVGAFETRRSRRVPRRRTAGGDRHRLGDHHGETVFEQTGNQTFATPSSRRVFFPNAPSDDGAERMMLKPGDERGGVDFVVPAKTRRTSRSASPKGRASRHEDLGSSRLAWHRAWPHRRYRRTRDWSRASPAGVYRRPRDAAARRSHRVDGSRRSVRIRRGAGRGDAADRIACRLLSDRAGQPCRIKRSAHVLTAAGADARSHRAQAGRVERDRGSCRGRARRSDHGRVGPAAAGALRRRPTRTDGGAAAAAHRRSRAIPHLRRRARQLSGEQFDRSGGGRRRARLCTVVFSGHRCCGRRAAPDGRSRPRDLWRRHLIGARPHCARVGRAARRGTAARRPAERWR